jgi:hypothetical protein
MSDARLSSSGHDSTSGHDGSFDHDISYGFLLKLLGGTVVFMVLVCAFIYWLYFLFLAQEVRADPPVPILQEAAERIVVPGPNLLATPEIELDRMRHEDQLKLDEYGWVDEQQGIAHVPIDRALDMVVEREALRSQQAGEPPADPSIDVPTDADSGGSE